MLSCHSIKSQGVLDSPVPGTFWKRAPEGLGAVRNKTRMQRGGLKRNGKLASMCMLLFAHAGSSTKQFLDTTLDLELGGHDIKRGPFLSACLEPNDLIEHGSQTCGRGPHLTSWTQPEASYQSGGFRRPWKWVFPKMRSAFLTPPGTEPLLKLECTSEWLHWFYYSHF